MRFFFSRLIGFWFGLFVGLPGWLIDGLPAFVVTQRPRCGREGKGWGLAVVVSVVAEVVVVLLELLLGEELVMLSVVVSGWCEEVLFCDVVSGSCKVGWCLRRFISRSLSWFWCCYCLLFFVRAGFL